MYENDSYIGMVIKIEIKLAITFQLFVTQKTGKKSYIDAGGAGIRVKMPQKFTDFKWNSESLLRVKNSDEENC